MTSPVAARQETRLPDAYALFAPVLDRLSEPLSQALRGLLEQLEPFFGAFDPPRLAPRGDFEGLGGLTLRGDIGQIVQSELLLRTEAPLEFLRRMAESETLYHDKLYADPGQRPVYRLMISVGPGSLGHGRIVALAAVFFMARVAAVRDADFHWCFLPRIDGPVWFDEVSVNTIKRLLRAAAHRELSAEDLAEAEVAWAGRAEGAAGDGQGGAGRLDWIASARPRSGEAPTVADSTANSLSFALSAPSQDQPRRVELRLRHLGRERRRAVIECPPDLICLGALKSPFRPPSAQAASQITPTGKRPGLDGWAPRYLVNPSGDLKMVRLKGGLLVLRFGEDWKVTQSFFAPLQDGVHLAGVRLYRDALSLMVHGKRSGAEFLAYGAYHLPRTRLPAMTFRRIAKATSEQLFRKQADYALPTLTHQGNVRFHSTSGNAFELAMGGEADAAEFRPLYNEPRMLASNGEFDVIRADKAKGGKRLTVLKASGYSAHAFEEGEIEPVPPALLGMVYTHSTSSLAYSVAPNRWLFPGHFGQQRPERTLTLKPFETLLAGVGWNDGVSAKIWSDARYGGDGEVRSVRFRDGQAMVKHPVIRLGEDAMDLVAVNVGSDGITWGVCVDRDGEPTELLTFSSRKGVHHRARHSLAEHRAEAQILDMERLIG